MPSTVTTFAVTQALLSRSIDQDAYLDAATKAALKTRITNLVRESRIVLDYSKVQSAQGFASVNAATKSIDVGIGAGGTNRVEFAVLQYIVPMRIEGTEGINGFLPGHGGASPLALIAQAGITLQYRLAAADAWAAFDRQTVLDEVTWIQFAADIPDQIAAVTLPAIHIHAEQV